MHNDEMAAATTSAITSTVLAARMAAGIAPAVLDVRSGLEYRRGHVPGAVHAPFWLLPFRLPHLTALRQRPLVVYCGHGPRAWLARAVLRRHGYARVLLLAGHMRAWRRGGHEVVRTGR
jgi:hydroxyacylglutathione hydrolase